MIDPNWIFWIAIVFVVLFLIFFGILFFLNAGTGRTLIIILTVVFLFIAVGLLIYYFFFITRSTPKLGPGNGTGTGSGTGPSGPSGNTGPSDNIVRNSDVLKILNVSQNQFACPCGTTDDDCGGTPCSLRTDASYASLNGDAVGLRNFQVIIPNGSSQQGVAFGDNIHLQSVTTSPSCTNCNNALLNICDNDPFVSHIVQDPINIGDATWELVDPNDSSSTSLIQYGQAVELKNVGLSDLLGQSIFLSICDMNDCPDLGSGCGPPLVGAFLSSGTGFDWNFTFVSRNS